MGSMSEQMQPQGSWSDAQQGRARNGLDQAGRSQAGAQTRRTASKRSLGEDGHDILEQAVKRDVIPRLMALPWLTRSATVDLTPRVGEACVKKLVALCLEVESQGVATFVADLHRSGVGAFTIYELLLTPVARLLGEMWEDDTCTLADVTIGILRLQNAQRSIATHSLAEAAPALGAPRALLLPMPGEQHTFGLSIVLDYFARAGWDARLGPAGSGADALAMVRNDRTELVGLSFACDDRVPDAKTLIAAIRGASANKRLIIMVGGPPFMQDVTLAASLGADATATDGQQAVLRANELLHQQPQARP